MLSVTINVSYSKGGKPVLVEFQKDGLIGEFVVASIADDAPPAGARSTKNRSQQKSTPCISKPPTRKARPSSRNSTTRSSQSAEPGILEPQSTIREMHNPSSGSPTNLPVTKTSASRMATLPASSVRDALFGPDPFEDEEDEELRAEFDPAANRDQFTLMEAEYDDEEMILFEDDTGIEENGEEFGPTQTHSLIKVNYLTLLITQSLTAKPKGLFD